MQELTDSNRSLANGNAVGPDGMSVELFKITLNGDSILRRILLDMATCIWMGGGGEFRSSSGNMPPTRYSIKRRTGQRTATIVVYRW